MNKLFADPIFTTFVHDPALAALWLEPAKADAALSARAAVLRAAEAPADGWTQVWALLRARDYALGLLYARHLLGLRAPADIPAAEHQAKYCALYAIRQLIGGASGASGGA